MEISSSESIPLLSACHGPCMAVHPWGNRWYTCQRVLYVHMISYKEHPMLQHRTKLPETKGKNYNISCLVFKVFTPQTDMTLVQEIVFRRDNSNGQSIIILHTVGHCVTSSFLFILLQAQCSDKSYTETSKLSHLLPNLIFFLSFSVMNCHLTKES